MANMNTFAGIQNFPAQVITGTSETALLVPATSGVYPGYPSPQFPASSGLSIAPPNDTTGFGSALDVREFKVRLVARVVNPGAGTLTVKLYQVPFANIGTISATGSVTSGGAPGSGDVLVHTTAALTQANPSIFAIEYDLVWSSINGRLDGVVTGVQNTSTLISLAAISSGGLSSGVATVSQLNFLPSFTFSAANAGDSVQVSEFVVERV